MKFSGVALACLLTLATMPSMAMGQPPAGRGNVPATPGANAAARRPIPETARGRLADRAARGRQIGKLQAPDRLARRAERTTRSSERTERTDRGRAGRTAEARRVLPIRKQDRVLQERLASIDRMRDAAIESADVALLERADQLERQVRASHAEAMKRGHVVLEDGSTVPFGSLVSEAARESGREFGQFTSEQARTLGKEFGKSNADKTRLLAPPVTETPTTEPLPGTETPEPLPPVTETTTDPLPPVTGPTTEPLPPVTEPAPEPAPTPTP